jgi:hypothetical protein
MEAKVVPNAMAPKPSEIEEKAAESRDRFSGMEKSHRCSAKSGNRRLLRRKPLSSADDSAD